MAEVWPGMKYELEKVVTPEVTAVRVGSGSLPVLATPMMIAWMEEAATEAIRPQLEAGQTSVGILVTIRHMAPTKVGKTVRVVAEVTEVKGNKVSFAVKAYDEETKIGEGCHERAIVDAEKFMKK